MYRQRGKKPCLLVIGANLSIIILASYHHLHECSLTLEHSFPNSCCTKVSVDKISHWCCWPLLYNYTRVRSSETLAAMVVPDDTIRLLSCLINFPHIIVVHHNLSGVCSIQHKECCCFCWFLQDNNCGDLRTKNVSRTISQIMAKLLHIYIFAVHGISTETVNTTNYQYRLVQPFIVLAVLYNYECQQVGQSVVEY